MALRLFHSNDQLQSVQADGATVFADRSERPPAAARSRARRTIPAADSIGSGGGTSPSSVSRLVGALALHCGDRDVAEELAQETLARRETLLHGLGQRGAMVLEVAPADLSSGLVDRYLEVKERGLL